MFRYIFSEEDKKVGSIILIFLLFAIAVYAFIVFPSQRNQFVKSGKVTIGTIIGIVDGRGTNDPTYVYSVDGVEYMSTEARILQGTFNFSEDMIGKKYFVVFVKGSPQKVCLLPLNPVPDSINEVPRFGWDKLPTGEDLILK